VFHSSCCCTPAFGSRRAWTKKGIEPSPQAVEIARPFGIPIKAQNLLEMARRTFRESSAHIWSNEPFGSLPRFSFSSWRNWFDPVPNVGTIGWGHQIGSGSKIDDSLLRGASADPNMTLTMALY
jgi:hypothetical protein